MSLLDDVQNFLQDLVLGDFAENPSGLSTVVNGAIGLIPVVDQLLDVRDVAGVIVRCNRKGWSNLQPDDHVDLAFAALGCIPELGSFLKGAIKPLYKNRKAAGKGVQAGIAMMERAFGMGKGGVVKWLKALNWAQNTQQAIQAAQSALALYGQVLQTIAAEPWWAPSGLVSLARQMQPGIKTANAQLEHSIRQGSKLIQDFVQELLGENAVYAQAALQVATSSAHHGKSHQPARVQAAAHSQAAPKRKAKTIGQENHPELQGNPKGHAGSGTSTSHHAVQFTRDKLQKFFERPMGLVAEHMVDYHVLHAEGGTHAHGSVQLQTRTEQKLLKVNAPHRPVELSPVDLTLLTTSGIDSLWKHPSKAGKEYLVVEAKGRIGAPSIKTGKAAKDSTSPNAKIPPVPEGKLTPEQAQLWRMLHDNADKTTDSREMQMSHAWIGKDLQHVLGTQKVTYERRVYLVAQFPTAAQGVDQHIKAIEQALAEGSLEVNLALHQAEHGISVEYLERDIEAVEDARTEANAKQAKNKNEQSKAVRDKPTNLEKVKQVRKGRTP